MATPAPSQIASARVLVVDDQPSNLDVLRQVLEPEGHHVLLAPSGEVALRSARRARPDLILLDVMMPGMDGFQVCRALKQDPDTADIPVLFITAFDDTDSLVRGFEAGAVDYMTKPFRQQEVVMRTRTHLQIGRLRRELTAGYADIAAQNERLEQEVALRRLLKSQMSELAAERAGEEGLDGLVADSRAMQYLMENVRRLQSSASHVAIHGPAGSGKELVARVLHRAGNRGSGPFVVLDGTQLPGDVVTSVRSRTLALARLFGHAENAVNGCGEAHREGCFQLADGGVLFLDHVTEVPVPIQASLSRALQAGRARRLGDTTDVPVDVRLLAASEDELEEALAAGRLDPTLHRLVSGAVLTMPPLSRRREDIPGLVRHFVRRVCRQLEREPALVTDEAMAALCAADYPANVRSLRERVERALLAGGGRRLEVHHLELSAPRPRVVS